MNRATKLALLGAIITSIVLAAGAANAAKPKHPAKHRYYYDRINTHQPYRYARRAADGVRIDHDGWRETGSWNNSCFRTLDYLHSDSACGGVGGF